MPVQRKKPKANAEPRTPSVLLADYRTCWLVKSNAASIDIVVKQEVFVVHKSVLTKSSEYFDTCLNKPGFKEASNNKVVFDDIDPKYMGFYIGLAASFATIVRHTPPKPLANPESQHPKNHMRDFVEVLKLCDRFLSREMGKFMTQCLKVAIGDAHRTLFRTGNDITLQKMTTQDFADAFEALILEHTAQRELGNLMIQYFCDGVNYKAWTQILDAMVNTPNFVAHVSKGFASKLADQDAHRSKIKRRELAGPAID
ncbi:hypothetical protein JDV02_005417 [Purpureocillium takamizusanense]|uniref:BTB domain-containing protein n=1 Tax=Purpureocillium takamizusanense TaxID=2060973 RepID=A0A9Q8VBW2_9HYPO|nr:uncharacterized protein JDV02_005417 [Purpureocillium takamizusanense]UNI19217.1 hypothetical protein JDV02_005417 [Purpureocillium takamizusanense]